MKKLSKLFKCLVCIMPAVLFFSYEPVITLGASESMNFELSLPLIWLVVFDVVAVAMMIQRKVLFKGIEKWWMWLLFPVWLTVSVIWSLNVVRGVLTVGILWLVYIAVYGMWQLRELYDMEFWRKFLRWFFGASLVACLVCVVQCVLDLAGVGREVTLMCEGCTYAMFGFPHPDGFAIEPQFMGNLLLAPVLVAAWLILKDGYNSILRRRGRSGPSSRAERPSFLGRNLRKLLRILLLAVLLFTLFLTFSRGAIYALIVGLVVMSGWVVMQEKVKRKDVVKRVGLVWGVVILSFGFTLNLQGMMAQISPTTDTYQTGVAKVLNHLSLGIIKIGEGGEAEVDLVELEEEKQGNDREEPVENYVENFEEKEQEQAAFDGYVAESTDTRLRLSGAAVQVWSRDFKIALVGVGLGGAGQALYNNGLSPAPKEITQNQYTSLLLETGLVGISLFILAVVLAVRAAMKSKMKVMVVSLMVAYAVSLCFFSGLPNALHIYLLLAIFLML